MSYHHPYFTGKESENQMDQVTIDVAGRVFK